MKNILSYEVGDEWYYMHVYYYASENSIIPNVYFVNFSYTVILICPIAGGQNLNLS